MPGLVPPDITPLLFARRDGTAHPSTRFCAPRLWRAAGAIRALMITMIEGGPRDCADGAHERPERNRAARPRDTPPSNRRGRDRTRRRSRSAIAASTAFLAKRRVHDGEAAARFGWTRRVNRGTSETTGSVRRSIEAVTEGLEGSAPGPHLDPPQGRQTASSNPMMSRGRSAAAASEHRCDHDRRRAPARLFDDR